MNLNLKVSLIKNSQHVLVQQIYINVNLKILLEHKHFNHAVKFLLPVQHKSFLSARLDHHDDGKPCKMNSENHTVFSPVANSINAWT